jgi:hypothetical protein
MSVTVVNKNINARIMSVAISPRLRETIFIYIQQTQGLEGIDQGMNHAYSSPWGRSDSFMKFKKGLK